MDSTADILDDASVRFEPGPGVRRKAATPVINDILANVRHSHGIGAHIMACALDFGVDRPRMPRVGNSIFVKDRKALAAAFRKWRTNRLYRGSS